MAVSLEQFVKQLEDSGILTAETLKDFLSPKASPKDAEDLARELVRQKKLTKFQAELLWLGQGKSLLLGNYVLLEKIGAGGMGQVFKAEHRRMHRTVAIKVLPSKMMKDAGAIARFEREVTAAARLNHSNIVTAYDADQANGVHFLVMELVEGSDLSAVVKKNGPLRVSKAVNYVLQAARGLEAAHAEGIVHRDIKPGNLLLDRKGTVKILDMGLARIEQGDGPAQAELTGSGAVMGTVDYMAPEQALSTKHADARADIYSLGCSLFYLLTGKATYDGDSLMAKLLAHRDAAIPCIRSLCPEVPEQVEVLFHKMVAKKVEDRYQTMTEVIAELERCGTGQEQSISMQQPVVPESDTGLTNFFKDVAESAPKPDVLKPVASAGADRSHKRWMLIGGGALLLLAAIVFFAPRKESLLRVEVPQGKKLLGQSKLPWRGWPADAPPPATAPFTAKQARKHQAAWAKYLGLDVEYTNSIGMKFVLIPPGEFTMGSTSKEIDEALKVAVEGQQWRDRIQSEDPQHKVILTQPVYVGIHEVTQGQYELVMGMNPSHSAAMGAGKDAVAGMDTTSHPVESVSWNNAAEFCSKLSEKERLKPFYVLAGGTVMPLNGAGYRLPTEAEWEYACRAGTTTKYWIGKHDGDLVQAGWFAMNSGGLTHAVGELQANPFGLYDTHGNVDEWVQDWWEPEYYWQFSGKPAINPVGPSTAGSLHAIRGGHWCWSGAYCRASFRAGFEPTFGSQSLGFRVSLAVDALRKPLKSPGSRERQLRADSTASSRTMQDPAFQHWLQDVAAMPAEKQVGAVASKLKALNSGFDWKFTHKIENGVVTELGFLTDKVTDISPVRALIGLKSLKCDGTNSGSGKLSDLSPLKGMPLTSLSISDTQVSGLSPLKGMKLTNLTCIGTQVSDLTPLKGMPLTTLACYDTPIFDLSPLDGMKLTNLHCGGTQVSELSSLQGMPLTNLTIGNTKVSDLSPLQGMKLTDLHCGTTQVSDLSFLQGMPLTNLTFESTQVSDLSPLKGMPLTILYCGDTPISDLSPLQGMNLTLLSCYGTQISDLSPLRGMPLTDLNCDNKILADFSPLEDMPLQRLHLDFKPERDTEILRSIKTLECINQKPVAEFWKAVDEQRPGKKP